MQEIADSEIKFILFSLNLNLFFSAHLHMGMKNFNGKLIFLLIIKQNLANHFLEQDFANTVLKFLYFC